MKKIGVLGVCQRGHGYYYAKLFNAQDSACQCRVTHAWHAERAVAEAFQGVCVCDTPQAVIDAVDGVMITTIDPCEYPDLATPALEQNKPVFLNRPMAGDPASARRMVEIGSPIWAGSPLSVSPVLDQLRDRVRELGGLRFFTSTVGGTTPLFYLPHALSVATGVVDATPRRVTASKIHDAAFTDKIEPVPSEAEILDGTGVTAIIDYDEFQGAVTFQADASSMGYSFGAFCRDGVIEPTDTCTDDVFEQMVAAIDRFVVEEESPTPIDLPVTVCALYSAVRESLRTEAPVELN